MITFYLTRTYHLRRSISLNVTQIRVACTYHAMIFTRAQRDTMRPCTQVQCFRIALSGYRRKYYTDISHWPHVNALRLDACLTVNINVNLLLKL